MSKIKYKRFTHPKVLKAIGRELLTRFFKGFGPEPSGRSWLPPAELPDELWLGAIGQRLNAPEQLPEGTAEALWAIDEMASPEGQQELEQAILNRGLALGLSPDFTREEMAMHVWLTAPEVLTEAHNRHRLTRLTAFEHFGTRFPPAERPPFSSPGPGELAAIAEALDPWFALHSRGENTTRVDLCRLDAANSDAASAAAELEHWFVIRHGDTYSRTPKVEAQKTEILHFRPERDDVVVYSAALDELRVNARTRGERELYVRTFGRHLRGSADYFSRRHTYTLEPLRTDGPAALDPAGVEGLEKITLRELEVAWDNSQFDQKIIHQASDLFELAAVFPSSDVIPEEGRLVRAAFEVRFAGCAKPRPVQIRLPNVLKLGRHCDASRVQTWLTLRRFRTH